MATEIKYKDTTIPVEAGQTVTLNTADKKFTEDIAITAPKGGGGGDARDYWVVAGKIKCSGASAKTPQISYLMKDASGNDINRNEDRATKVFAFSSYFGGNMMNAYVKVPKGGSICFLLNSVNARGFQYFKSEKLGFHITNADGQTEWISINEDVYDLECYAYSAPSGAD